MAGGKIRLAHERLKRCAGIGSDRIGDQNSRYLSIHHQSPPHLEGRCYNLEVARWQGHHGREKTAAAAVAAADPRPAAAGRWTTGSSAGSRR